MKEKAEFEDLRGKILFKIDGQIDSVEMIFTTVYGEYFRLYHDQDCCEGVYIEDIIGDLDDLIGVPILFAEKVTSGEDPEDFKGEHKPPNESFTWTFYKLSTIKGSVTIRWLGESNGCYAEEADFERIK